MARDDEDIDAKRTLGVEASENFWKLFHQDCKSLEEYSEMVTTYCVDPNAKTTLLNQLEKFEKGVWTFKEDGRELTTGNPNRDMKWYVEFHTMMKAEFNKYIMDKADPLTQVSILSAKRGDWYEHYVTKNPKLLISWTRAGAFGYIRGGEQGSGKTFTASLIADDHVDLNGGVVCTNVMYEETVEKIIWSNRASVILRTACELANKGILILVIIDETAENISGVQPLIPKNIMFDKMARSFRKLEIASLYISHFMRDFPFIVKEKAIARFSKPSVAHPDRLQIHELQGEINGYRFHHKRDWIKGVPKPRRPCISKALATFNMDIDFEALWEYLSKLDMKENQHKAVIDWLDGRGFSFTKEEKVYLAHKMKDIYDKRGKRKLTNTDMGIILNVSEGAIRKYLSIEPKQFDN